MPSAKPRKNGETRYCTLHCIKVEIKTWTDLGGLYTSEEFRILSEDEVLRFVRWDMLENTMVVLGVVVLVQGKRGVPIGGHLAGHTAELWAMFEEDLTF